MNGSSTAPTTGSLVDGAAVLAVGAETVVVDEDDEPSLVHATSPRATKSAATDTTSISGRTAGLHRQGLAESPRCLMAMVVSSGMWWALRS